MPLPPPQLNRRRFIATVAAGSVATQLAPSLTAAEAAPKLPPSPAGGIDSATLAAAEKLAGLSFTAEQRAPLIKGVAARAAGYAELRTTPIPNHVVPALAFDPRLSGVRVPTGAPRPAIAPWQPAAIRRPTSADDLAFLPIAKLAALLRSRQITSRELTELALSRLKRYDPVLTAVVNLTEERAWRQVLIDARTDVWVSQPGGPHLAMTNLTGHPTVCVPTGFLPVKDQPAESPRRITAAMTFHSRLYRDELALAAAPAFQQTTDWHLRRPPIA